MNLRILSLWAAVSCVVSCAQRVEADPPEFPYQATVQNDEVEVRAGPSDDRYYATGSLTRGQQVTVHRHDRGGWYMISPPPGSFDWIDAAVVERQGADAGVIIASGESSIRAFVRYGSLLGDDHSLFGRELAVGDRVRILGEQTLETELGPRQMLKIEPPAREYRWVKGDFIVAVDPVARREQDLDPYRIPSSQFSSLEYAEVIPVSSSAPTVQTEAAAALEAQLGEVDLRYADMMRLEPSQWDLDNLAASYLELRTQGDVVFQGMIDQRLQAIEARRGVHADFMRLQQIRDETTARDQQLQAALQQQPGAIPGLLPMPVDLGTPAPFPVEQPTVFSTAGNDPEPFPAAAPQVTSFASQTSEIPAASPTPATPVVSAEQLAGAGVLQRVQGLPAGQPSFALVAPDGQLLTLLLPEQGVSLEEHEGNPVGVIGERSFNTDLQADITRVRQIMPVQLAP